MTAPDSITLSLFIFFNSARVLFYVPSFIKMAKAQNNLNTHSLITWFCWIFANFTTGMAFFIHSNTLDAQVVLNYANTFMCCIGLGLILYKRYRYKDISEDHHRVKLELLEEENDYLTKLVKQHGIEPSVNIKSIA